MAAQLAATVQGGFVLGMRISMGLAARCFLAIVVLNVRYRLRKEN